jgi:hypothetical protein
MFSTGRGETAHRFLEFLGPRRLKRRSTSLDAHGWPSTTALLNMMRQDTEEGLAA